MQNLTWSPMSRWIIKRIAGDHGSTVKVRRENERIVQDPIHRCQCFRFPSYLGNVKLFFLVWTWKMLWPFTLRRETGSSNCLGKFLLRSTLLALFRPALLLSHWPSLGDVVKENGSFRFGKWNLLWASISLRTKPGGSIAIWVQRGQKENLGPVQEGSDPPKDDIVELSNIIGHTGGDTGAPVRVVTIGQVLSQVDHQLPTHLHFF